MPQLDLSEAICDPMILDRFVVIRRSQDTNNYGEMINAAQYLPSFGIVTIGGDNSLDRGDAEQHAGKTLSVVTKQSIRTSTRGFQPDLIQWHGDLFLVTSCDDYSTWGTGWFQVEAKSIDMEDLPQIDDFFGQYDFSDPNQSALAASI